MDHPNSFNLVLEDRYELIEKIGREGFAAYEG